MLGRWRAACEKQGWRQLPAHIQETCKEAPNYLRRTGVSLKGRRTALQLPPELVREFDKVLASRIHGLGPGQRLNEVLNSRNIRNAVSNMRRRYNDRLSKSNDEVFSAGCTPPTASDVMSLHTPPTAPSSSSTTPMCGMLIYTGCRALA